MKVAQTSKRQSVRMPFDQNMGDLYPFSLRQKLAVITETSPYYSGSDNPWRRPIIPMEMLGVRRTESAWIKTRVFDKGGAVVATMLLNMATLKDSYAPYEEEHRRLYGAGR